MDKKPVSKKTKIILEEINKFITENKQRILSRIAKRLKEEKLTINN